MKYKPPRAIDLHFAGDETNLPADQATSCSATTPRLPKITSGSKCTKSRPGRQWSSWAMSVLASERARADDTPLTVIPCPELAGINLVLKDESKHPTGSLKHRLAHALFAHAICNNDIGPDTLIVEASSGSTAISEAWFARRLGLRFLAVVPATTIAAKVEAIRALGGEIELAPVGADISQVAAQIACARGGFFMDQFTRAAEATDWRGSNNIADNFLTQLANADFGAPAWLVTGAGTGGTSTTIGRYLRFRAGLEKSRLCVVDPEGSSYFKAYNTGNRDETGATSPYIEGIGRPSVAAAFQPQLIDLMMSVSDEASISGAHWLMNRSKRKFGPSTGTSIIGALMLGQAMANRGEAGTIALIGCDDGDRYRGSIFDPEWCRSNGIHLDRWRNLLDQLGTANFPAAF